MPLHDVGNQRQRAKRLVQGPPQGAIGSFRKGARDGGKTAGRHQSVGVEGQNDQGMAGDEGVASEGGVEGGRFEDGGRGQGVEAGEDRPDGPVWAQLVPAEPDRAWVDAREHGCVKAGRCGSF